MQVSKEASRDVFGVSESGGDERRGGAALQLDAHPQASHTKRRLHRSHHFLLLF